MPHTVRSHRRVAGILTLLLLIGMAGLARRGGATERMAGRSVVVPPERTVSDDLIAAGNDVLIQGQVTGDVIAAGANVTLTGYAQGDAILAGANVTVGAPVGDDLRALGANVTVSGAVGDNASIAGSSVTLSSSARVRRDADLAGGTVKVLGAIGRNLALAAGDAELGSEVQGSVSARVDRLRLLPGAIVRGDLVVYAPRQPEISPEAQVLGNVIHHPVKAGRRTPPPGAWLAGWLLGWGLQFVWLFLVGAVMLALTPRHTEQIADTVTARPGPSLLTGCLTLILLPILGVLLLITLVGIPLAAILFAIFMASIFLAGAFVAFRVGTWVMARAGRPDSSPYARLAVGALIVAFFTSMPWIGGLLQALVVAIGLGALLLARWDLLQRLRTEGLA